MASAWSGADSALTDLMRFLAQLSLYFRSGPDGHLVQPTATIRILTSRDEAQTWSEIHKFGVPTRDTRDPHFLVFHSRLFVDTGSHDHCDDEQRGDGRPANEYGAWRLFGFPILCSVTTSLTSRLPDISAQFPVPTAGRQQPR